MHFYVKVFNGENMIIKRDTYLNELKSYEFDGQIKVITGIRRCGKSFLLFTLFKNYLLEKGIPEKNILSFELDQMKDLEYRNPMVLSKYVREKLDGMDEEYYLFIDEVQLSDTIKIPYNPEGKEITFYDMLNDLRGISNLDIYVTGSNSKMLSKDILTEFRGRSDEIRVHPLSFKEYYSAVQGDKNVAFDQYAYYGGLPYTLTRKDNSQKAKYLESLFQEVYIKDIIERQKIQREDVLSSVIDLLCSSVGSLTNSTKVSNSINSKREFSRGDRVSSITVNSYIQNLEDAYLFQEALRYDVKGKSYLDYPKKYYCVDMGLRNARTGFRQVEMTHIMENIIFNELLIRGYKVDIGVVYENVRNEKGNTVRVAREIDFVCNKGNKRLYIQSAYAMEEESKKQSEIRPLEKTGDFFPKIIVRRDIGLPFYDEKGILNIGIVDFLLSDDIL